MLKVTVVKDKCFKCGACMMIASDIFGYSQEGYSVVKKDIVDDDDKDALMAKENCPTGAIVLEKIETTDDNNECSCQECDLNNRE